MSAPSVEQSSTLTNLVGLSDLSTAILGQVAVLRLALEGSGVHDGILRLLLQVEGDLTRLTEGIDALLVKERGEPRLTPAARIRYENLRQQIRRVLAHAPDGIAALERIVAACAEDLPPSAGESAPEAS